MLYQVYEIKKTLQTRAKKGNLVKAEPQSQTPPFRLFASSESSKWTTVNDFVCLVFGQTLGRGWPYRQKSLCRNSIHIAEEGI